MLRAVVSLALLAAAFAGPLIDDNFSTWNELVRGKGIFQDENVNMIQSKSNDDTVLLGQFGDVLGQIGVLEKLYSNYRLKYNKTKSKHSIAVFKDNLMEIASHNMKYKNGLSTYVKGVNQFTDMTIEDIEAMYPPMQVDANMDFSANPLPLNFGSMEDVPEQVDWRDAGIITSIKDQGQCTSCAMFAAAALIESVKALSQEIPPANMSAQELVDCAVTQNVCSRIVFGSNPNDSMNYLQKNGISTWESYPYTQKKGWCRKASVKRSAKVKQWYGGQNIEEDALKNIVASTPAFVAIYGHGMAYDGGIMDNDACGNNAANHAVLAVGYGTNEDGIDFWIIKNSWGAKWGSEGYLFLRRNNDRVCQIAKSMVIIADNDNSVN